MKPETKVVWKGEADGIFPLDDGQPGFYLAGLREVSGQFEGTFAGDAFAGLDAVYEGETQVVMYGPDPDLPLWRHWFYRLREVLTGKPYPEVVVARGPAVFSIDDEYDEDDNHVIRGSFSQSGEWWIR